MSGHLKTHFFLFTSLTQGSRAIQSRVIQIMVCDMNVRQGTEEEIENFTVC